MNMPRRVELRIAGDTVQKSRSRAGVQGEGNVTDLVCSFDASWDDLAKTLTFWDAEMANPVKIVLTENMLTGENKDFSRIVIKGGYALESFL